MPMSAAGDAMQALTGQFVDAFNRRDADGIVALSDPDITYYPTVLVGAIREYRGHDGMRRWLKDLDKIGSKHQIRLREVRVLDDKHFIVRSDVLLDGKVVGDSAMMARLTPEGLIAEAHTYLLDDPRSMIDGTGRAKRSATTGDKPKTRTRVVRPPSGQRGATDSDEPRTRAR
jgi:ketosteroid isomerase-like protein